VVPQPTAQRQHPLPEQSAVYTIWLRTDWHDCSSTGARTTDTAATCTPAHAHTTWSVLFWDNTHHHTQMEQTTATAATCTTAHAHTTWSVLFWDNTPSHTDGTNHSHSSNMHHSTCTHNLVCTVLGQHTITYRWNKCCGLCVGLEWLSLSVLKHTPGTNPHQHHHSEPPTQFTSQKLKTKNCVPIHYPLPNTPQRHLVPTHLTHSGHTDE